METRNEKIAAALIALLAAGGACAQSAGPFGGPPQPEPTKEMKSTGLSPAAQPLPSQLTADQRGMRIYRMQDLPTLPDGKTPMAAPSQSWPNGSGDTLPPFGMPGQSGQAAQTPAQAMPGPIPLPGSLPALPQGAAGQGQAPLPSITAVPRLEAVFPGKRPTASAAGRLVSPGSKIGGSRVVSIDRDGVTLANGRTILVGDPVSAADGAAGGDAK